jgi:hypothetical protein
MKIVQQHKGISKFKVPLKAHKTISVGIILQLAIIGNLLVDKKSQFRLKKLATLLKYQV